MRTPTLLALLLVLTGLPAFQAAAENPRTVPSTDAESARLYQTGVDDYARGDSDAALASFRKALRLSPQNASALAAVLRLESEAAHRRLPPPSDYAPPPASRLERFLLVSVPRWYYFERTIGDGLRDVGALESERIFENDRQLREPLRRAPLATFDRGQA